MSACLAETCHSINVHVCLFGRNSVSMSACLAETCHSINVHICLFHGNLSCITISAMSVCSAETHHCVNVHVCLFNRNLSLCQCSCLLVPLKPVIVSILMSTCSAETCHRHSINAHVRLFNRNMLVCRFQCQCPVIQQKPVIVSRSVTESTCSTLYLLHIERNMLSRNTHISQAVLATYGKLSSKPFNSLQQDQKVHPNNSSKPPLLALQHRMGTCPTNKNWPDTKTDTHCSGWMP